MSLVQSAVYWVRQSFAWSNSWPSWRERLVLASFVVAAAGLAILSGWLPLWLSAGLWALLGMGVAVGSRQGWLKLFGPVLFYDMIRTARQSRYVVMRMLYAGLLLAILFMIFFEYRHYQGNPARETALLAETFFTWFMIVQLSLVVLLTPAYVAGAIAEEKARKTLEFMLATDLSNHEIVLSKLLSRLANLTLFLLTGLPILSILQFVGGVDAPLMLAGFAGTGLTMLGIASVSILFSTLFQRPRDAVGVTYLTMIAYGALGSLGKSLALAGVSWTRWPIWFTEGAPTIADAANVINAGNPISAVIDIGIAIERATLAATVPGLLTGIAWFHGGLALVCILWSIVRLRAVGLAQTVSGTTQKRSPWSRARPPIGELPMLWKELHIEGRTKLNWIAWGTVIVLILLTVGSGLFLVAGYFADFVVVRRDDWLFLGEIMNRWFRVAGTGLATLMLLMLAVRASSCVSHERERDTFDALLTTPLSAEAILWAKLLGCMAGLRMAWLWLGSMIALAVCTGGLHPLAVPIIVAAWFIYAAAFTQVGIWYSMVCASSMRATVYTVLTTLFLGGGHWLLMGLCCYFPAAFSSGAGPRDLENVAKFEAGLTPPFVFAWCSYSWENLRHDFRDREFGELVVFSLIGMFLWAMAGVIAWTGVVLPKFKAITRREETPTPPAFSGRRAADDGTG